MSWVHAQIEGIALKLSSGVYNLRISVRESIRSGSHLGAGGPNLMVFHPAGLRIWTTEVVAALALTVIWMVLEADSAW